MKFRIEYEEYDYNFAFGFNFHYIDKYGRDEYGTDVVFGLIINLHKYQWEFILANG